MGFCSGCGNQYQPDQAFCANCGSKLPDITEAQQNEGKLLADVLAEEKRVAREQEEARAKELRQQKQAARRQKMADQIAKIRNAYNERKALWRGVAALLLLVIVYGVTQSILFSVNGPEAKLKEYISVLKDGNFDALDDQTLFPGASADTPENVKSGYDLESMSGIRLGKVVRNGMSAQASIYQSAENVPGEEITIELKAGTEFWGVFQIPVWKVTTEPNNGSLNLSSSLEGSQTVLFGTSPDESVADLRQMPSFYYLPGHYKYEVSSFGYFGKTSGSLNAWYTQGSELPMIEANANLGGTAYQKAHGSAVAKAKKCAKAKCRKLPRYGVNDFNLWSQYDRTTYTNSRFNYKYRLNSCDEVSAVATSATAATYTFNCNLTAKGHLYVRYVYYYGYFSDYWYYWNFYDEKQENLTVVVEVTTNGKSTSYKTTSSTIN